MVRERDLGWDTDLPPRDRGLSRRARDLRDRSGHRTADPDLPNMSAPADHARALHSHRERARCRARGGGLRLVQCELRDRRLLGGVRFRPGRVGCDVRALAVPPPHPVWPAPPALLGCGSLLILCGNKTYLRINAKICY